MSKSLPVLTLLAASLIPSTYARADEMQEVMDVQSDGSKHGEIYHFTVVTDFQGDVSGVAYYEGANAPRMFTLAEIRRGAVLLHDKDHNLDAVVLSAGSFSAKDGGELHMNYLSNGIFHKHPDHFYPIKLLRNGASWAVYDYKGAFTHMFLRANHAMGIIIGISSVETY